MKRGGSLIGQGSFGCVFNPAIPCRGIDPLNTGKSVGKVFMHDQDASDEMKLLQKFVQMDPDQKYFIYSTEKCELDQDYGNEPDVSKCTAISHHPYDRTFQTIMPNGGVTLREYLITNRPVLGWSLESIVKLLEPVFAGVDSLIRNDMVHQDIKTINIVVNDYGEARLIDFGLILPSFDLYREDQNGLLRAEYFLNPPEYRLMRPMNLIEHPNIFTLEYNTIDFCESDEFFTEEHEKSLQMLWFQRVRCTDLREFQSIANDRRWWDKADIYSLGLALLFCSTHMDNSRHDHNFVELVNQMIMPHPDHRIGMHELRFQLDKIWNTFDRPRPRVQKVTRQVQ